MSRNQAVRTSAQVKKVEMSFAESCPVRDVLDRFGDKWSILILYTLENGTLRFTELKNGIPDISQRMLAKSLRTLECDGYLSRRVYPTIPPKVEYTLTPLGKSLIVKIDDLIKWAVVNHDKVRASRKRYVPPEGCAER